MIPNLDCEIVVMYILYTVHKYHIPKLVNSHQIQPDSNNKHPRHQHWHRTNISLLCRASDVPFVRKHHATYVAGLNAALAAKGGAPAKGTLAPEIPIAVDLNEAMG